MPRPCHAHLPRPSLGPADAGPRDRAHRRAGEHGVRPDARAELRQPDRRRQPGCHRDRRGGLLQQPHLHPRGDPGVSRHLGEHPRGPRPRRRSARRPRPHRHGSAARRRGSRDRRLGRALALRRPPHVAGRGLPLGRGRGDRLPAPHRARDAAGHAQRDPVGRAPLRRSAHQPDDRDDGDRRRELGDRLLPRRRARAAAVARRRRRRLGHPRHRGRQGAHPAVDGLRPAGRRRLEPARQRRGSGGPSSCRSSCWPSPSASPSCSGPSGRSSTTSSSRSSATRPSPRPRSSRPSRASSSSAASV